MVTVIFTENIKKWKYLSVVISLGNDGLALSDKSQNYISLVGQWKGTVLFYKPISNIAPK
jgi:hypothetical protein